MFLAVKQSNGKDKVDGEEHRFQVILHNQRVHLSYLTRI